MPREVRTLIFSLREAAEATAQPEGLVETALSDMPLDQLRDDLVAYCDRMRIPLPRDGMKIANVGTKSVMLSIELLQNRRQIPT